MSTYLLQAPWPAMANGGYNDQNRGENSSNNYSNRSLRRCEEKVRGLYAVLSSLSLFIHSINQILGNNERNRERKANDCSEVEWIRGIAKKSTSLQHVYCTDSLGTYMGMCICKA